MAIRKLEAETTNARKRVAMKVDPTRIDSKKLKLGKQTARHDVRTLLLATYATPALPPPLPPLISPAKSKAPGA